MGEGNPAFVESLVVAARRRLSEQVLAQGEKLDMLGQGLEELRARQKELEAAFESELEAVATAASAAVAGNSSFEKLLGSVRNIITATLPEQVFEVLSEEGAQMGVRAAVFDVRGKAAWGASMGGFGRELTAKALRTLVVPLSQDNPFRQAYETGGHVDLSGEQMKKVRNLAERLKPAPSDVIMLLPIRSAGSVSAISYFDTGGKSEKLPVDALKILAEFAGAQLDRLMALSGGVAPEVSAPEPSASEAAPVEPAEEPVAEAEPLPVEVTREEPAVEAASAEPPPVEAPLPVEAPPPPPVTGVDLSQLSEEEQRTHKDAKRFAKLLVSEIELYNKTKVSDGRKNKDLYKRLKADIERSRQTYEKRFGKTLAKQHDYFHEELVRTLAANDPSVLGGDDPGPSA
ncbi:MAG: hypothetical protein DMG21_05720 [Acidobacteria bacterium]|nr:MAG: hypothetical protein DMG21_05720 [Acidobacteriota bacterium]